MAFSIEGLPELPVVLSQARCQYLRVEVADEGQHGGSGVADERVLEGGEI